MNNYDNLVKYVYRLLLNVHNRYLNGSLVSYQMILLGMGNLKVEVSPGAGHNYYAVSDAIHMLYKEDPKCKDGYIYGLKDIIDKVNDFSTIILISDYISYELKKLKEGQNTFTIELKPIISSLIKVIQNKQNKILESQPGWYKQELDKYLNYLIELEKDDSIN